MVDTLDVERLGRQQRADVAPDICIWTNSSMFFPSGDFGIHFHTNPNLSSGSMMRVSHLVLLESVRFSFRERIHVSSRFHVSRERKERVCQSALFLPRAVVASRGGTIHKILGI